jgi:hypothetical protein
MLPHSYRTASTLLAVLVFSYCSTLSDAGKGAGVPCPTDAGKGAGVPCPTDAGKGAGVPCPTDAGRGAGVPCPTGSPAPLLAVLVFSYRTASTPAGSLSLFLL